MRVLLVVALLALALVTPGRAGAAVPQRIGTFPAGGDPVSDGLRFVAFEEARTGRTRLIDTKSRSSISIATPAGCSTQDGGGLGGVGGGQLAWGCGGGSPPMLMTLSSGRFHQPVGWSAFVHASADSNAPLAAVGREWLRVLDPERDAYLNWRTGASVDETAPASSTRKFPDLNAPRLRHRMCSPLKRRVEYGDGLEPTLYERYQYERPFGLRYRGSKRVLLDRCGSSRSRLLVRCEDIICRASLSAGYVTWVNRRTLVAYAARRGTTSVVARLPGRTPDRDWGTAHTKDAIFAWDQAGDRGVYQVRRR